MHFGFVKLFFDNFFHSHCSFIFSSTTFHVIDELPDKHPQSHDLSKLAEINSGVIDQLWDKDF